MHKILLVFLVTLWRCQPYFLSLLRALGWCHSGFSESSQCWLGSAGVVQGKFCFEVPPGLCSVEQTCSRALFCCCPSVLDFIPGFVCQSGGWCLTLRPGFPVCSIPRLMGMGTEAKARSVFSGLSTIFVLSSEMSSHVCEESLYPGG